VRQAKGLGAQQPPTPVEPEPETEQPAKIDEVEAWLQDLEGEKAAEHVPAADETAMWLKSLDEAESAPSVSEPLPSANIEELGKSEQERDDSFAWLENLAARQGATEGLLTNPEERLEEEPEWVRQAKDLGSQQPPVSLTPEPEPEPASVQPTSMDDTAAWLRDLDEEEPSGHVPAADETAMWLKSLDEAESKPVEQVESSETDLPAWMQNIKEETAPPEQAPSMESEWKPAAEQPVAMEESKLEEENIPSWLAELDEEEEKPVSVSADDDLPAWLRAEEHALEATEPTRPSDWQPLEEKEPEIVYSPPLEETRQPEIIYSPPLEETKQPEPEAAVPSVSFEQPEEIIIEPQPEATKAEPEPVREEPASPVPEPYQEPVMAQVPGVVIPSVDPVLGLARNEISRNNISGALESYGRLIRKGRFLDEVIYDLRDALYRYPVDVSIWQSLGDAYMRANRLQDALDAYTKAEDLLR
jgi:tetratricopeptide (TPR) repeat protein